MIKMDHPTQKEYNGILCGFGCRQSDTGMSTNTKWCVNKMKNTLKNAAYQHVTWHKFHKTYGV